MNRDTPVLRRGRGTHRKEGRSKKEEVREEERRRKRGGIGEEAEEEEEGPRTGAGTTPRTRKWTPPTPQTQAGEGREGGG